MICPICKQEITPGVSCTNAAFRRFRMKQIGFYDLEAVFSGKRTVLHMPLGVEYPVGETFLATATGRRTGRVCEILDSRVVRLRDDLTAETLTALNLTLAEYRSRWNHLHKKQPVHCNPKVLRVTFQCTDVEEPRSLSFIEEEDLHVFDLIEAAIAVGVKEIQQKDDDAVFRCTPKSEEIRSHE